MSFAELKKNRQAALEKLQKEFASEDIVEFEDLDEYRDFCGYNKKNTDSFTVKEYMQLVKDVEGRIKYCADSYFTDELYCAMSLLHKYDSVIKTMVITN